MEPAAALDHTPVTELFAVPVRCSWGISPTNIFRWPGFINNQLMHP